VTDDDHMFFRVRHIAGQIDFIGIGIRRRLHLNPGVRANIASRDGRRC
jgi:hypothetical protein